MKLFCKLLPCISLICQIYPHHKNSLLGPSTYDCFLPLSLFNFLTLFFVFVEKTIFYEKTYSYVIILRSFAVNKYLTFVLLKWRNSEIKILCSINVRIASTDLCLELPQCNLSCQPGERVGEEREEGRKRKNNCPEWQIYCLFAPQSEKESKLFLRFKPS